jgi:phosphoribosylaminoimidazole-succinocarboxamide synthase
MKLLEGKVKTVFETENAEEVMIEYHDKVTAGNGEKDRLSCRKGFIVLSNFLNFI